MKKNKHQIIKGTKSLPRTTVRKQVESQVSSPTEEQVGIEVRSKTRGAINPIWGQIYYQIIEISNEEY
jgi:hypothetical protein